MSLVSEFCKATGGLVKENPNHGADGKFSSDSAGPAPYKQSDHWKETGAETQYAFKCKHCGKLKALMESPSNLKEHVKILHPDKISDGYGSKAAKRNPNREHTGTYTTGSEAGLGWKKTKVHVGTVDSAAGVPHPTLDTEYQHSSGLTVGVHHDQATGQLEVTSGIPGSVEHTESFDKPEAACKHLAGLGIEHQL